MARLRTLGFIGFAMLASMATTAALALPTSAIYVTDFDSSIEDPALNPWGVSVMQGQAGTLTATDSWRHGALLGTPFPEARDRFRAPVAVAGQIDVAGPFSHAYNLDGSGQVSTLCFPCSFLSYATDGTTDGTYNYAIGYELGPSGDVGIWRTDRNWSGEQYLFDLPPLTSTAKAYGITFDPTSNSLWVLVVDKSSSGGVTSRVLELGLDGTLKSQFNGFGTANGGPFGIVEGALAMDYSDNTLWWLPLGTLSIDPNAYINQFSTTGQFLSSAPLAATRWI